MRTPIPHRDMKREVESWKPGEVTTRQMTAEERERMDKIKPIGRGKKIIGMARGRSGK